MIIIKNFISNFKFKKKILSTTFFKCISSFGVIFFYITMQNNFSAETTGVISSCISVMVLLSVIVKFGYNLKIIKNVSLFYEKYEKSELSTILIKSFFTIISLSFFIIITIFFIRFQLGEFILKDYYKGNYFLFISALTPVFALLLIQKSFFKGFRQPEISFFADLGSILFCTSLLVYLFGYLLNFNLNEVRILFFLTLSVFIIFSISSIFMFFLLIKFYTTPVKKIENFQNIKGSLVDFFLIDFSNFIRSWGIIFISSIFLENYYVGTLSSILWLASTLLLTPIIINSIFIPYFVIYSETKKYFDLIKIYKLSKRYILIINLPILFIFMFFDSFLLQKLFNITNINLELCFNIIVLAMYIRFLLGPINALFVNINKEAIVRNLTILFSLMEFVLIILMASYFGILGVAISLLIVELLRIITFYFYYVHFLKGLKI